MRNVILHINTDICASLKQNEDATDKVGWFVASLNGCFENFPEGSAATKSCFELLLKSIHHFIGIFLRQLQQKNHLSPARRSEVFIDLHNSIRFVLFGIQQFNAESPHTLEPILKQCWFELLGTAAFVDSPIDTKINCGILKVHYDRLCGGIFAPREKILSQFDVIEENHRVPVLKSVPVLPKSLFYAVAIINTMDETDLLDVNFYPALKAIIGRLIEVGKIFTIDSCLIMAVTRALVQCSKKLLSLLRKVSPPTAIDGTDAIALLRQAMHECLAFVWINVHHSVDCVRYLSKDLLKNLLKLGQEQPRMFSGIVDEAVRMVKCQSISETLICLLLDYLGQVFSSEFVLKELPNIQQCILENLLLAESGWAVCYEHLMSKNTEIDHTEWCNRWIRPLMDVDASEWKDDFDRLKIIRNMFERALKAKPEAAEYILADPNLSIEIYLFVLWIMRRSGRKIYAPENYCVSSDSKVIYAKVHPTDEIRILAFRILIECHKTSAPFSEQDFHEILEFFRYNCNDQSPSIRQQMNTTMKRAMLRIECGYSTAKRNPNDPNAAKLCKRYEQFLKDLIEFCVDFCLFEGANFGRRSTGLAALHCAVAIWQKLVPNDTSIYSEKLWIRLQRTIADSSYKVHKDVASDILQLCWQFYPDKANLIYTLDGLKKLLLTFRPYDVMTAANYLVFCAFSRTYFAGFYDVTIWCEKLLAAGLAKAKVSLLHTARYNALYGLLLTIRSLLKRIDFANVSNETERDNWRAFFHRIIPMCKELTDVAAPVVNSSAPEGHLPNDLNDVSHYLSIIGDETMGSCDGSGAQVKVTAQMILLCAWRTVRESALLLGEIAQYIPIWSPSTPNGLITVEQLLYIGSHFQQLLIETKHRGAFEQSFLGFSKLCLRLWRADELKLHSYPMKLVQNIAAIVSGNQGSQEYDFDSELDVKKLCATRRSAGVPFMVCNDQFGFMSHDANL